MNAKWKMMGVLTPVVLGLCVVSQGWAQWKYNFLYDSETGRVKFSSNVGLIYELEFRADDDIFLPPKPQYAGLFDVHTAQKAFKLDPVGFDTIDWGNLLPPGMSVSEVRSKVTVSVNGSDVPWIQIWLPDVWFPQLKVSLFYQASTGATYLALNADDINTVTVTWSDGSKTFNSSDLVDIMPCGEYLTEEEIQNEVTVSGSTIGGASFTGYELYFLPAPEEAIGFLQDLIEDTAWINIHHGIENSLDAKLDSALNALDDLNASNDVAAYNSINAFINHVKGQSGNQIVTEDAEYLIEWAEYILLVIGP